MHYSVNQFQVSCYTYEGIDAVKDALRAGIACSTEVVPVRINLIAPPLYVMTTSTTEKTVRIPLFSLALESSKTKTISKLFWIFLHFLLFLERKLALNVLMHIIVTYRLLDE